jgi:hypothetical protein
MTFTVNFDTTLENNKTGNIYHCNYCPKQVSDTTRCIKHLDKFTGEVQPCANMPPEVKKAAQHHLGKNAAAAKRKIADVEDRTVKLGAGGLAGLQARPGYHLPGSD